MPKLPYYKDSNYSKGSNKKVIYPCPTCKTENIRPFRECHNRKRCQNCCFRINNEVIPLKEAIKICTKGSHRKTSWECKDCGKTSISQFRYAISTKKCKECTRKDNLGLMIKKNLIEGNPFKGKKHTEEYLKKKKQREFKNTAKKAGFGNYQDFVDDLIKFLEDNKVGPNSALCLLRYPNLTKETIRQTVIRQDRLDLITKMGSSSIEDHIYEYIRSFYSGKIIRNDRKTINPKEIDIYLPELKIAFEYNGIWWHSEKYVDKYYHYNKYQECLKLGIRLYNIWDYIYINDPKAMKLFIKNLIIPKERVFARKCKVTKDAKRVKDFIKNNHLQKLAPSHTYLGLEYQGTLVMAISVSNHHRKGAKVQVLNRVCFSKYSVVGGLNKLLKLVEKPLITWSDNSYSPIGNMYKNSGFKVDAELSPDYFYSDSNGFFKSKQSQAKKASKCPDNLTEHVWALERGLYRVYDCGKTRWVLE